MKNSANKPNKRTRTVLPPEISALSGYSLRLEQIQKNNAVKKFLDEHQNKPFKFYPPEEN